MKKFLKGLFCMTLIAVMAISMFACAKDEGEEEPADDAEVTEAPADDAEVTDAPEAPEAETAKFGSGAFSMNLPEGFTIGEREGVVAFAATAEGDNIALSIAEAQDMSIFTEETLSTSYALMVDNFADFVMQNNTVAGNNAIITSFTGTDKTSGQNIKMSNILIFAEDATYTFGYTSVSGNYDAVVDAATSSIAIG